MAYDTAKHTVFSDRVRNWMKQYQELRDEADRLDEIYVNETASASHADFTDTAIATKQEHVDAIVHVREFKDFTEGSGNAAGVGDLAIDRRSRVTPFTQ